jgi:hypothetical protein
MSIQLLSVSSPTIIPINTTIALPASCSQISFQSAAGSTIEASNDGSTWGTLAVSAAGIVVSVFTAAVFIRTAQANTTVTAKASPIAVIPRAGLVTANLTVAGIALFADGTSTVPSIAFSAEPATGISRSGASAIRISLNVGGPTFSFQSNGMFLLTNASSNLVMGISLDSNLSRLGAASLAIGNGNIGDFTGTLKLATLNAVTSYQANGVAGVTTFGPAAVASITVKQGIITAIS